MRYKTKIKITLPILFGVLNTAFASALPVDCTQNITEVTTGNWSGCKLFGSELYGPPGTQPIYLSFASFIGTNLRGSVFKKINFTSSNFNKANLSDIAVRDTNFSAGTFIRTNFSNSIIADNTHLDRSDFSNANFSNVIISNSSFENNNFANANFANADIYGSKFKNIKNINKLKFTAATKFESVAFVNTDFSHVKLSEGMTLERVEFIELPPVQNASFTKINLLNSTISPIVIKGTLKFEGAHIVKSNLAFCDKIEKSKCLYEVASPSKKILFNSIKDNGSNFKLNTKAIVDFTNATLNGTSFEKSQLVNANFTGAIFNDVDFRGANLSRANFSKITWANFLKKVKYDKTTYFGETKFQDRVCPKTISFGQCDKPNYLGAGRLFY